MVLRELELRVEKFKSHYKARLKDMTTAWKVNSYKKKQKGKSRAYL